MIRKIYVLSLSILLVGLFSCGEDSELIGSCAHKEGDVIEKTLTLHRNTTYTIEHVNAKDRCGEIISIQLISAQNYKASDYPREVTFRIKIAEVITAYSYIGFVIEGSVIAESGIDGNGKGNGNGTFSSIIGDLTDDIIASSGGRPIDVVFVVDASGSMQDNINAVAEHLAQMTDAYKASEIDYRLGLTHFNMVLNSQQNNIQVFQLLQDLSIYKRRLYEIIPTGDENALDAIAETLTQMRFRTNTVKHLIVVTDEPFTSMLGHSVRTIIGLCKSNEVYVNVLGENLPEHKQLAEETGGTWHAVPKDPMPQTAQPPPATPKTIGNFILKDATNMPVDIILFIDGSKSMENKTDYVKEQIDLWIRDWDNANIKYRLGVVRFRAKQSVNIVNVFKPPQTQKQIHSILRLPCQEDENLYEAVLEGIRRLKLRQNVKTHFIFITDEPGNPNQPITGTIGLLKELPVTVSVIGTTDTFQQFVAQSTGGVYVKMPNAHKQNSPNE